MLEAGGRSPTRLLVVVLLVAGLVAPGTVLGGTTQTPTGIDTDDPQGTGIDLVQTGGGSSTSELLGGGADRFTTGGPTDWVAAPASRAEPPNGSNASAGLGRQLATVVTAASDEVETDVEGAAFDAAFERAGASERADLVAERAADLADRAADLEAEYLELVAAYREGETGASAFAFRVALLNSRAANLEESIDRLQARARTLSADRLRAAGWDRSTLPAARRDLATVTGIGSRAVFDLFTGELPAGTDVEVTAGERSLSIAVDGEDGERSREFDAVRDADPGVTVSESEALSAARSALSAVDGQWVATRSRLRRDDGYYAFEFEVRGPATSGEAEVSVDGSTGRVFHLEEEIEPADDPPDRAPALELRVLDGTPGPGETVTLQVLADGDPAANATVYVEGEPVGTTGADGTLRLDLPAEGPTIEAEYAGAEAELEFEYDADDAEGGDEKTFALDATYDAGAGTVSVAVTRDGSLVPEDDD